MVFPEKRYNFTTKKYKKASPGKILLIILCAVVIAGGGLFFFLIRNRGGMADSKNLTEIEAIYEYWRVKKYDNVISTSKNLLRSEPLNRKALALGGFSYFYKALGEYAMEEKLMLIDKAIIYLRKLNVSGSNPYPEETEYVLGKAYFHKGKYYIDESITHLKKSLEMGYIQRDIYEYLGLAYSEIERYEESIEYFVMAADIEETPLLYLTIGQTYYQMNDKTSAEEYLLRAINRTKDAALEEKCRYLLAQIYIDSKELLKAITQYEKILEKNPQAADAHFQLGVIYNKMDDTIKARAEWRKTLQIDPSHYGARYHYYD